MSTPVLRVGILGATEVLEHTFFPTLNSLPLFETTIIHAYNDHAVAVRSQQQFSIPYTTTSTDEVLHHPEVDLVLNFFPFESHEKTPSQLWKQASIKPAHRTPKAPEDLRRLRAPLCPVLHRCLQERARESGPHLYARCRNISGSLAHPAAREEVAINAIARGHGGDENEKVSGNGTKKAAAGLHLDGLGKDMQMHALMADIFSSTDDITPDREAFCRFLGTLGCHDLSLMREALGFPDAVANVSITDPFYSAIFHYTNPSKDALVVHGDGHPFTVMYETGVDAVPRSDAHLTVYGANKTASLQYEMPVATHTLCKAGCVRVVVEEAGDIVQNGDGPAEGTATGVKRMEYTSLFADAYEKELLALHAYLVDGVEAKTSDGDAMMDLQMLRMIFDHYDRQCGTIRTPLG
ncbi:Oxidoreductase N-terminal [Penicillium chermesinum]|nr:Oxidoreductase N-terminal [Penicillium chermesinum]